MPALFSNLLFQGGSRIRGLLAPLSPDEPLRKVDGSEGGGGSAIVRMSKMVSSTGDGILGTIELAKVAQIINVSATTGCRVRFYGTEDERDADSGRAQGVEPDDFSGLQLEVIIPASHLNVPLAPVPTVYCNEVAVTRFIPYIIEPYYDEDVDVTFTYLEIES